jgi:hypothetical protein
VIVLGFLGLLGLAFVLNHVVSRLRPVHEMGCAEFLAEPPSNARVRVTGCVVDLRHCIHYLDQSETKVTQVIALVRHPSNDGEEPARAVFYTSDPELMALVTRSLRDIEDLEAYDRFQARYMPLLWRERPVDGSTSALIEAVFRSEAATAFGDALGPDFVQVTEPSEQAASLAAGLVLLIPSVFLLVLIILAQSRWESRRRGFDHHRWLRSIPEA